MSPDAKAKLTFFILGSVYFAGGIEHGVSVPRGWLHWRRHAIQAPNHVVGLSVAAYSVATFFVSPFVGRWVDKPGRSRRVILLGACLHIIAATVEIFVSSQWVTILTRFISGIGGGADAAVLSETSRYTSPSRRTSAMALLIGSRLLGYLLVPGLDSLLWRVLLTQIQLPERRTAALGLFLVVLWTVVLLLTATLYTELCRLQPLSLLSPPSLPPPPPHNPANRARAHTEGTAPSGQGEDGNTILDVSLSSAQPISIPASLTSSLCSDSSANYLGKSSEMIEEVEKYIQLMAEQSFCSSAATAVVGVDYSDDEMESAGMARNCELKFETGEDMTSQMSTSFNHDGGVLDSQSVPRVHRVSGVSVTVSSELLDQNSYMKRSGVLPTYLQRPESLLYILYEEFIRHDIIALLSISMSATFALLCFQMMIVPVTQEFLDDVDLYPLILFCLTLVLLLMTCGCVWGCGVRRRVLLVLVCGACVLVLAIALFMVFLYLMANRQESREDNMARISVCVGLYVVGFPLLLIPATSLFTLLSTHTHHGLRQGVYHSALSVSAILAPLWIEGTTTRLLLHHSVIVALLLISLVTICCSGQHISALHTSGSRRRRIRRPRSHDRPSTSGTVSEHQHLLA